MSAISGTIGAILGANAQNKATSAASKSQKATNAQNLQFFNESRGSTGSAVLPTYLKNPDGSLFEGSLGTDLVKAYGETATPLSTFQAATGKMAGAQKNANDLTNNIFNGGITREMQDNAAPVQAARMATARSSSLDALHKTLDEIDSTQAQRGYVGDSYGNRLLNFQAGRSQGDAVGAADITNKQENADIKNYGDITLPLQNVTLPFNMAQENANYSFLPNAEYLTSVQQRMQPFAPLNIGTGTFQTQPLPTAGPGAYSGAANALSNISGLTSGAGGAYMQYLQQQNQNQLTQQYLNKFSNTGALAPGGTALWNSTMPVAPVAPMSTDFSGAFTGAALPDATYSGGASVA